MTSQFLVPAIYPWQTLNNAGHNGLLSGPGGSRSKMYPSGEKLQQSLIGVCD